MWVLDTKDPDSLQKQQSAEPSLHPTNHGSFLEKDSNTPDNHLM